MYSISGHHHISMITKDAKQNNHFYRNILGLRRVKKTVNQDDPSMYHLFYGDKTGSPGTELSFFEMKQAGHTHKGTNAITQIGLLVSSEITLNYWLDRFDAYGVRHGDITVYANRQALHFEDPDGLALVLIVSDAPMPEHWEIWTDSAVPEKHQIRGMGPIEITVKRPGKLARTLTQIFGFSEAGEQDDAMVFQSLPSQIFGEIRVKSLDGPSEKPGRGSIHHLAIQAKDETELKYWDEQVRSHGFHSTGIVDRYYFKSLYFRESNGILFEIATDGPGFSVDGDVETLGEGLDLPPFLEKQRIAIQSKLQPIE